MAIREGWILERWKCRAHRPRGCFSPSADSSHPAPPLTPTQHPQFLGSRAARLRPEALSCLPSSRLLPCLSQRGGALGSSLQVGGFCLFHRCHAREHHSPVAPAPERTLSPALRLGIVHDPRGWGKGRQHPPGWPGKDERPCTSPGGKTGLGWGTGQRGTAHQQSPNTRDKHCHRGISTQGAESRGKAPRDPGKRKVNGECQAGWGRGAGTGRPGLRKQPVQTQWGTGCPEQTDTECLSVTLGATKGL